MGVKIMDWLAAVVTAINPLVAGAAVILCGLAAVCWLCWQTTRGPNAFWAEAPDEDI